MCGIVSYIGDKEALPILIKGLERLEYRGYDSAGIFIHSANGTQKERVSGKVENLKSAFKNQPKLSSGLGMGHTRWATHGQPNQTNAHPHTSNSGRLVMVHNGIIENYDVIKTELSSRGYTFSSETDSEVLVNLIEDVQKKNNLNLEQAVQIALNQVVGAYGIVIFDSEAPDTLISARLGSPLAIGIGDNDFFVGSDATPFIDFTQKVVYLEDYEIAILQKNSGLRVRNIKRNINVVPYVEELQWNLNDIQKGGFEHFMLKEIFEQPNALRDTLRGRIDLKNGIVNVGSLSQYKTIFKNAKRIIIVACGTSWHAGLVGEYLIESIARLNIEV